MVNMKSGCGDNGNSITVFEFLENQPPLPYPSFLLPPKDQEYYLEDSNECRREFHSNGHGRLMVSARWD